MQVPFIDVGSFVDLEMQSYTTFPQLCTISVVNQDLGVGPTCTEQSATWTGHGIGWWLAAPNPEP